ncbi:MAG: family N-acetyltransferase [Solirubrobacterales bacterium]|nr:family N-acetyltransferase [Solirubrobacterales bacterium]
MWSMNQLYVEGRRPELTAAALTAELDRGLADARHRRAVVTDDATGRRLAADMRKAGYGVGVVGVLLLDREPPEPAPGLVREIDEPAMRALETRLVAENPDIPALDRTVVVDGHAHMRSAVPGTRTFAGLRDGEDVCQTTLYARDGVGQPEDVETLTAHRGRGIAAATVSHATREALASGCDLVFILCHLDEGPVALYAGLGYRAAGRFWTFTRQA